jgi:TusA-related sulfurtransferase
VLLKKFFNVGFEDIQVLDRWAVGFEVVGRYPLFTREFLDFLRAALPPSRHDELVYSIVVTARRPERRMIPVVCPHCRFVNAAGARFCNQCGGRLAAARAAETLPEPDSLCDLGAEGCGDGTLLKIRRVMAALAPGQILEIRALDPVAEDDVPAWCRMTGHEYLGASATRYFVRKR